MSSSLLPAALAADLLAELPGTFLAYGADKGGDVDAAFDDAVEQAGWDYGFAKIVPSVANVDAGDVDVITLEPMPAARAALLAVRALHAGGLTAGRAYALPICADSALKRRRVRLVLDDVAAELDVPAGRRAHVSAVEETYLRDAATSAGTALDDGDVLEQVDLVRGRARYRPVVEVFRTASSSEFIVVDPTCDIIVSRGHRTAGDARRAAVELAKSGPVAGSATGTLAVFKLSGREGGLPLLQVLRSRIAARYTLKLTVGTVKDPTKTKVIGWVFFGTVPHATDATQDAAQDGVEGSTKEPDDGALPADDLS